MHSTRVFKDRTSLSGYGSQHIAMSPVQVKVSNFSQPISGLELTVDDFWLTGGVDTMSSRDRMTMEKLILLQ